MILIIFTEQKLSTGYMIVPVAVKDKRTDLIYVMSDRDVFFSDKLNKYEQALASFLSFL